MIAPANPAAAPRPTSPARANAIDPAISPLAPRPMAKPIAASGAIASPGSLANPAPVTHVMAAIRIIAMVSATR